MDALMPLSFEHSVWKSPKKVPFNIASQAQCYQTWHFEQDKNWWKRSATKIEKFKCDNLSNFLTLCLNRNFPFLMEDIFSILNLSPN